MLAIANGVGRNNVGPTNRPPGLPVASFDVSWHVLLLLVGGFLAGVINSMAGGGSMLTVPLLIVGGVEPTAANGSNRIAVLIQNITGAYGFARRDAGDRAATVKVLVPVMAGALIGAVAASQIPDELFRRLFGLLMFPLLYLTIRKPDPSRVRRQWPWWATSLAFVLVGAYGGAVQAGVGLLMLLMLARAGFDLVTANAIKTVLILAITLVAIPVFLINDQVRWVPALILSVGMGAGGYVGANVAVDGGERLIRPVLIVVVIALATRLIGLWG